jgi:hypothetical protein
MRLAWPDPEPTPQRRDGSQRRSGHRATFACFAHFSGNSLPQKYFDMKTKQTKPTTARERRWVLFSNGCIHGIQHSELLVVRSVPPHRSVVQDSVAVFTVSKTFSFIAALAVVAMLLLLLTGCSVPRPQKGGGATSTVSRPGHTNSTTLTQSENPKEASRQTVQSEQTMEYVLPAGTAVSLGDRRAEDGGRRSEDGGQFDPPELLTPNFDLLSQNPKLLSSNSHLLQRQPSWPDRCRSGS